jgi:glucose/arabinose dehydrogenase
MEAIRIETVWYWCVASSFASKPKMKGVIVSNPSLGRGPSRLAGLACIATVWGGAAVCLGQYLPPGFQQKAIVTTLTQPIEIEFEPDGGMLVAERVGRLVRWKAEKLTDLGTIPNVDYLRGEGGLLGMALHPEFSENRYIYIFYTALIDSRMYNRVSRFELREKLDLESETIIWEIETFQRFAHNAGAVKFGPDGMLYFSTGDQFEANNSQTLSNPHGKILRIDDTGAIPADNPFYGEPDASEEIWAYGFRNPFRFVFDEVTGDLWVGDVGYETEEELDLTLPGRNYGWPLMEGETCYIEDCSLYEAPAFAYRHDEDQRGGRTIIAGPVYYGAGFPEEYQGTMFVGDFMGGYIRGLRFDNSGKLIEDKMFNARAYFNTDIEIGPDGSLYYTNLFGLNEFPSGVYKVEYVGSENQSPVAVAEADVKRGEPPLKVKFSGAKSYDPDNAQEDLYYYWSFGDSTGMAGVHVEHEYPEPGRYWVRLAIDDGTSIAEAYVIIDVGYAPTVSIDQPDEGTLYRCGDTIHFSGSAIDQNGELLPASAFTWTVDIVRKSGSINIAYGPLSGATSGSLQIPTTGRPLEESSYVITLTVKDETGFETTVKRTLPPDIAELTLDTVPSGIPVFLDGFPIETPYVYRGPIGFRHHLEAQASFTIDGSVFEFERWNADGGQVVEFSAAEGGANWLATYGSAKTVSPPQSDPADNAGDSTAGEGNAEDQTTPNAAEMRGDEPAASGNEVDEARDRPVSWLCPMLGVAALALCGLGLRRIGGEWRILNSE